VRERESVKKVEFITMWVAFQVIVKILYLLISVCVFVCVFVGGCLKIGIMCVCVRVCVYSFDNCKPNFYIHMADWQYLFESSQIQFRKFDKKIDIRLSEEVLILFSASQ